MLHKRHPQGAQPLWLGKAFILILAAIAALAGISMVRLIYYEMQLYNSDTLLFWTVGRGMANGLTPYQDLFESKPPGIFIMSALSYSLTDTQALTHLLNGLCFLLLALTPPLALIILWRKKKRYDLFKGGNALILVLAFVFGIAVAQFVSLRAGMLYAEPIAITFACLYILLFCFLRERESASIAGVMVSAILILSAAGTKEPFILVLLAAALILSRSLKQFLTLFTVPLAIAIFMALVLLAATNILGPFTEVYLPYMLSDRLNLHSDMPLILRIFDTKTFVDLAEHSLILFMAVIALLWLFFHQQWKKINNPLWISALKTMSVIALINLSVSVSGSFFHQHFATPAPIYICLFIMVAQAGIRWEQPVLRKAAFSVLAILFILVISFDFSTYDNWLRHQRMQEPSERTVAAYVDAVLDRTSNERYFLVQYNGAGRFPKFYAFTRHSPYGPLFNQNMDFLMIRNADYTFESGLEDANLVVFSEYQQALGSRIDEINRTLNEDFTETPWELIKDIPMPQDSGYRFYFRKVDDQI
jgi:hypothetical protein